MAILTLDPVETGQLLPDHFSIALVEFAVFLQISLGFFWRKETDGLIVPRLIWEDFDVKSLLEVIDIGDKLLVASLTLIGVAAGASQVVDSDLRLVDNEQVP